MFRAARALRKLSPGVAARQVHLLVMSTAISVSGLPAPRIQLAIALVCVASLSFSLIFAAVKFLGAGYSPFQVLMLRYAIGLAIALPFVLRIGRSAWTTARPRSHVLRATWGVLSTLCMFFAVTRMPLATITALSFSMPLFLTALSLPLLGERVGWHRVTATVVGFCGVLIVLGPPGDLNWVALIGLAGALFYSLAVISIRQLSVSEPSVRIFLFYALANIVICGAVAPWVWVAPSPFDWALFALIGSLGSVAQYCFIVAYRYAPASVIAPFDYSQLLFAPVIGYSLWQELPTTQALIGGGLITASGLFIWWRERQLAAQAGTKHADPGTATVPPRKPAD